MTTFLLVRHGQTDAIGNYLAGTARGTPLNDAGRLQVQRLAERLQEVHIAAVVSSPMTRTLETAHALAAPRGLSVAIDPAFAEFEVGDWTGRRFPDLDGHAAWQRFNAVRSLARPPGGELMLEVQQRAISALLSLALPYAGRTVAVVSHGDVIRAALMYFLGMPIDMVHRLEVSPGSVSIVALNGDGPPVVHQVNGNSVPSAV